MIHNSTPVFTLYYKWFLHSLNILPTPIGMKSRLSTLLTLLVLLLTAPAPVPASAQGASSASAEQLLKRCADKLRAAKCLKVLYTATADGRSSKGQLIVQGDKFTLSSEGMQTWFDGKTQWTYSPHIGEVNIVTPSSDELRQINPLRLVETFSNTFRATLQSSRSVETVTLTPLKSGGDIVKAVLSIDPDTLYPFEIVITLSNRQTLKIKTSSITPVSPLPASAFRYEKSRLPGVPVVDLR